MVSILTLILALGGELQSIPIVQPVSDTFQCVLPYVSGGGMVTLVNSSEEDQIVEITVNNAYRYNVTVTRNSSYSFQSPTHEFFFIPIIDGGPISFKSSKEIVAYTILTIPITVHCSDPSKLKKIFVGNENTGFAVVNLTKSPVRVSLFQDNSPTPILVLTVEPESRRMGFLREAFPISTQHDYMLLSESKGIGLFVVSYDSGVSVSIPLAEQ